MAAMQLKRTGKQSCPDCKEEEKIIEDYKNGYNVCGACGCTIGGRIIDEKGEWRTFSDSAENPSRVGGPSNPFLDSEQLDTLISSGAGLSSYSLAKTQMKSSLRGPERALINGLNLITAFCERKNLSKTISDAAKYIFKTVEKKKVLKGKNLEGVAAACIYIACRKAGFVRTFKEVSVLTAVPKKEIGRCYKAIFPHIEKMAVVSTEDIVARFCSDLTLSIEIQKVALAISKRAQVLGCIAGKSPDSIAAAIIYLITYLFPTQKKIQKDIQIVTNVTDVTIKNTYKELLPYRYELVPEGLVPKSILDTLPNS
ncbi:transcription initiation factor TFIIB [Nematocida homosporus]|uniref:transcription initiation factor TFIIB n=1 Tax=Nematocida homosporus TaxID=1912981 RepID=UPI00221E9989|nr:transcription initiation factor TFIIB [Nematocida homosporus]KAI5184331.1 transcription initiation factor TFIIB [Nematocida homosporus]